MNKLLVAMLLIHPIFIRIELKIMHLRFMLPTKASFFFIAFRAQYFCMDRGFYTTVTLAHYADPPGEMNISKASYLKDLHTF